MILWLSYAQQCVYFGVYAWRVNESVARGVYRRKQIKFKCGSVFEGGRKNLSFILIFALKRFLAKSTLPLKKFDKDTTLR
jgi:hypothetical protein